MWRADKVGSEPATEFQFSIGVILCCYHLDLPPIEQRIDQKPGLNHLRFYNDQGTVEIKGLIEQDPKPGDKTTQLQLAAREIRLDEEWHEVSGTVLLFVPRYSSYEYGDLLQVRGELETPIQFDEFDYESYLLINL